MKYLKIAIVVIVIIIIIIIGVLVFLTNGKPLENFVAKNIIEEVEMINDNSDEAKKQITVLQYYEIKQSINQYLNVLNKNSSIYFGKDENNDYVKIISDENIAKMVYKTLSKNYIQNNKILENNVFDYVMNVEQKVTYIPIDIQYVDENGYVKTYVTSGILVNDVEQLTKSVSYLVNIDEQNNTFAIEPIENQRNAKYLKYGESNIEKNDFNEYSIPKIREENISQEFFENYKKMLRFSPNLVYDKLSKDYAQKRFGTEEKFQKYVQKNKEEFSKNIFTKYLVNYYDDYTEYVCQDQYECLYIFKSKENILDYTIELDTYTLYNEKFLQKYNSSNDQYKVAMNIDKWVQMLNNRDYQSAFKVLDETFRKTNFDNDVDKFEEYMRQYFPEHYKLEFGEFSEETGTYMQEITLKDITGQDEKEISKTIYMELKEGTNFVMSFNLTRH